MAATLLGCYGGGTAACVAQVFLPAGSRDFPVPCSGPPCHRSQAIHHHPQSHVLTGREPDAPRESLKHGTGKSRVPADKQVGATTPVSKSRSIVPHPASDILIWPGKLMSHSCDHHGRFLMRKPLIALFSEAWMGSGIFQFSAAGRAGRQDV